MKKRKTKKNKFYQDVRFYFNMIVILPAICLSIQLWILDALPLFHFTLFNLGMFFITALVVIFHTYKKFHKKTKILVRILMSLMSIILILANVYVFQGLRALNSITVDDKTEYDIISVIVLKESKAKEIDDVKNEVFGTSKIDVTLTNKAVKDINKAIKKSIKTQEFPNLNDETKALYDKDIKVMIVNESYRALLSDSYPKFANETKVIYQSKFARKSNKSGTAVDVTKESFNVYISGVDTYGPIATQGRSDVNIIASVNPNTKQILLTSVPRDYYIKQTCQGNQNDKLTHTGIFGVGCTLDSMAQYTNLTMNYYLRVNFSSLEEVVDALGGIDIYNESGFYSGVDGSLIPGGDIHVNGSTALKFSRERHAYADGDRQRGRNQMIVINSIIDKATSPAILGAYSSIMETVGGTLQTNLESGDISALIKKQINEGTGWEVEQQSFTGGGDDDWSPANGFYSYVMYPDQASVDAGLVKINELLAR